MKNYTISLLLNKDANIIFNAVKNFKNWWSQDIQGNTDILNETFIYHYKDIHFCKIKFIEEIPNTKLVYQILDNEFKFTKDKSEWKNTKLIFELTEVDNKKYLTFTHEGLTPEYECFEVCNEAWTNYIKNSLFNLITKGNGSPNPKADNGFNAYITKKWNLDTL